MSVPVLVSVSEAKRESLLAPDGQSLPPRHTRPVPLAKVSTV